MNHPQAELLRTLLASEPFAALLDDILADEMNRCMKGLRGAVVAGESSLAATYEGQMQFIEAFPVTLKRKLEQFYRGTPPLTSE